MMNSDESNGMMNSGENNWMMDSAKNKPMMDSAKSKPMMDAGCSSCGQRVPRQAPPPMPAQRSTPSPSGQAPIKIPMMPK